MALAAVAALAVVPWRAFHLAGSGRSEITTLADAIGPHRAIEGRLTGAFQYGPLRAIGPGGQTSDLSPDVRLVIAEIVKHRQSDQSVDGLTTLAIAHLAVGDAEPAVPLLEQAVAVSPPSASLRSDLAAAYLARARTKIDPQDLSKALVSADLATKQQAALAEAWFNRALALDQLSLRNQGRQAWADYLRLDGTSRWAEEARRRIEALTKQDVPGFRNERTRAAFAASVERDDASAEHAVRDDRQTAREWTEEQLLVKWPHAALASDSAASAAALSIARRVAGALASVTGDRFLLDAVLAASRAAVSRQSAVALANAHLAYRTASEKYDNNEFSESGRLFTAVRPTLVRAGSPLAMSAKLQEAITSYYAGDVEASVAQMDPLIRALEPLQYGRLLGLAHRMRGLLDFVRARFDESMAHNLRALAYFRASGDEENVAGIESSIAENFDFLGEPQNGWMHRVKALQGLTAVRSVRRRHTILISAVLACVRQGTPEAAAYFQADVLANARLWNRPELLAEAYTRQAEVHGQFEDTQIASSDIAEARRWLKSVPDGPLARQLEARILLASASFARPEAPQTEATALTDALTYLRRGGLNWALAKTYLARGRAFEALNRPELAESDFIDGIREFERQRAELTAETSRVSYFDQPWDLFSEMVRLQARIRKQPDTALTFAERGRARTLLESVAGSDNAAPFDVAEVRRLLDEHVAVLYYALLRDGVLVWRLTKDHVELFDSPVHEDEMGRLIGRVRNEIDRGAAGPTETSTALYDLLVRPALDRLPVDMPLVIIPDGTLHALPFAALVDRKTGRYLVQDHAVAVAPSASVFLKATSDERPSGTFPRVMVIGSPTLTEPADTRIPDLPDARREIGEIAGLYSGADALSGADATKQRFLQAFANYDIVHFGGHAISNNDFPQLSRLLLASDSDGTIGSLFAHELQGLHFRARVLVLAACQTSGGRITRGEGVLSLARPFLAAGVSTVVATLWDVEDRSTRSLMLAVHRALRDGVAPPHALREAQLSAIASPDASLRAPKAWAGFVVVGALGSGPAAGTRARDGAERVR
jgi:CHAT domain-containing protein